MEVDKNVGIGEYCHLEIVYCQGGVPCSVQPDRRKRPAQAYALDLHHRRQLIQLAARNLFAAIRLQRKAQKTASEIITSTSIVHGLRSAKKFCNFPSFAGLLLINQSLALGVIDQAKILQTVNHRFAANAKMMRQQ